MSVQKKESSIRALFGQVLPNYSLMPKKKEYEPVYELAKSFFANQMAVAMVGSACFSVKILTVVTIGAVLHLAAKKVWEVARDTFFSGTREKEKTDSTFYKKLAGFSIVNAVSTLGPNSFIHEMGHTLVGLTCFEGKPPTITVTPGFGGCTSMKSYGLKWFGTIIGESSSLVLFSAGGVLASTFWCVGILIFAAKIREKMPEMSQLLQLQGYSQVWNEVLYGLSAFSVSKNNISHDFIAMWNGGIHPVLPIAVLLAAPLLTQDYISLKKNPSG